jgi:hypothetical protein
MQVAKRVTIDDAAIALFRSSRPACQEPAQPCGPCGSPQRCEIGAAVGMITQSVKSLVHRCLGALGYRLERLPSSVRLRSPPRRRPRPADDSILRLAKEHLEASTMPADLPPLGDRWGAYAARLRARIRRVSSLEELIFLGQSGEAGIEKHWGARELPGHCRNFDLQLSTDLPAELYDAFASFHSPGIICPDYTIEYRGRMMDFVSLCAANTVLRILSLIEGERPRTICDIGGGTGTIARSWMTSSAHRPELLAIIDIPETLVYSEALLRSELEDGQVQYLADRASVPNRSGVILCPVGNIAALEGIAFDLVTNTASMQEMTDAWVDWYMDWLDRQPCRLFYSDNYFANPLTAMQEGHNSWSPRPSARWQLFYSHVALDPLRNFATMFFRKDAGNAKPTPPEAAKRGADGWLAHLDAARSRGDEPSLRRALDFAQTSLPFVPKEAWQVAATLAKITKSAQDQRLFQELDRMRAGGTEAVL